MKEIDANLQSSLDYDIQKEIFLNLICDSKKFPTQILFPNRKCTNAALSCLKQFSTLEINPYGEIVLRFENSNGLVDKTCPIPLSTFILLHKYGSIHLKSLLMPNFACMDQYIKVSTALPAIKFEHISLARHRAITFRATKHATPFSDVFKEELRRILTANLNCLKSLTNIDLSSIQDFPVESLNLDEYTDTIEVFDDRYMNFFTRLNAKSLKLKICYEDPGSFPLAFLDFSKASELHIEFFVRFMVDAYNIYGISNNFKNEHLQILSITSEYMLDEFSYSKFFMCVSRFYPNLRRFSLTLIQAANKHVNFEKCFIEHDKNCESAIEEFRDYPFDIFVSLSGREELSIGVASKEYEDLHETLINAHFVKKKTEELVRKRRYRLSRVRQEICYEKLIELNPGKVINSQFTIILSSWCTGFV